MAEFTIPLKESPFIMPPSMGNSFPFLHKSKSENYSFDKKWQTSMACPL
jgi:hypothetical protein